MACGTEKGVTLTLNRMGHSIHTLTTYSQAFIEFCRHATLPVLDIGAAFGIATLPALQVGARVISNDVEARHLDSIKRKTPQSLQSKLTLLCGRMPDEIDLEASSLAAIHASQVLHFLTGPEITQSIHLMFRWLRPGGKVFIISGTPYVRMLEAFIPVYEARKKAGLSWPGFIEDLSDYSDNACLEDLPKSIHFLDTDILEDVFKKEGFLIEELSLFDRQNLPAHLKYDGRENVGLIARKPIDAIVSSPEK